ncbi:hypothetical protein D3C85_590130 [compost metagenome]
MKQREFTSLGFILGLFILLLNDFYLKNLYGNWLTGKLSDFAGLFIFPMFWAILFPHFKNKIYFGTLIIFIYWKSELSNSIIEFINHSNYFKIQRVVDLSDLLALTILPISYLYNQKHEKFYIQKIKPVFIVSLTSFAFMATSYSTDIDHEKKYSFNYSLQTLKTKIYYLKGISNPYEEQKEDYISDSSGKYKIHKFNLDTISFTEAPITKFVQDTMDLFVYEDFCFKGYSAKIKISGDSKNSKLELLSFHHSCPKNEKTLTKWNNDEEILSQSFENKIIEQLKIK